MAERKNLKRNAPEPLSKNALPILVDEQKVKRLKYIEEAKRRLAAKKKKKEQDDLDWMKKRFGCLSGSNVNGLTGRSVFGNPKKTTFQIFQIYDLDEEGKEYCRIGNDEEPLTLRRAADKWGFVYILEEGHRHFIKHKKYPFIGTTVDQLTEDGCVEAKFKAKRRSDMVPEMKVIPGMHLDQCMLHIEINERPWCALVIASDIDIQMAMLHPTKDENKEYWDGTWPIYLDYYNTALAWYWEQDLSKATYIVNLMFADGLPWEQIGALLQKAFTNKHDILVDGKLPVKPKAALASPIMLIQKTPTLAQITTEKKKQSEVKKLPQQQQPPPPRPLPAKPPLSKVLPLPAPTKMIAPPPPSSSQLPVAPQVLKTRIIATIQRKGILQQPKSTTTPPLVQKPHLPNGQQPGRQQLLSTATTTAAAPSA